MFSNNRIKKNYLFHRVLAAASSTLILGVLSVLPEAGLAQSVNASSSSAFKSPILLSQNNSIQANSAQEETLYLNNDRVYSYNLIASQRQVIDGIVIPAGATIVGRYEPADGGLRYVARAVVYDDYTYSISATSEVLEDVKDPRDTDARAIAEDSGIGAAVGTAVGEVFGDADVEEVIGGAAVGAAVGNVTADRVVVIEPNEPIVLYSN